MEKSKAEKEIVERIPNENDKGKKKKWIETISTILLSAATVLSAWCVFQSSQWSGEQYFRIDDETAANQFRLQNEVGAAQRKTAELQIFLQYTVAVADENAKLANFLYERFPSSLKKAFDAWSTLGPYNNPNAPRSPFQMKEYVVPEVDEAAKYEKEAAAFKKAANIADNHADNYVLVSLVLSMVLFFCGLSGVTDSYSNQRILIGIALLIFFTSIIFITTMPVQF